MYGISFGNFISEIESYESDTFSSNNTKITRSEARRIAEILLNRWSSEKLDGVSISSILENIRD